MTLRARFEGNPEEGFDKDAVPAWQLLRGTQKIVMPIVTLVNADGAAWSIVNQNVVDADELTLLNEPNFRFLQISGASPGVTFLDVLPPRKSGSLHGGPIGTLARLEISVKELRNFNITFHFLRSFGADTTRTINTDNLVAALNDLYVPQASIAFARRADVRGVEVNTTLSRILSEHRGDLDVINGKNAQAVYDKADPAADFNVFFMPGSWSDLAQVRMFGSAGLLWCPDEMTDDSVTIALPHMIGRSLGCLVNDNAKQKQRLMHRSRAEGDMALAGSIPLIGKDCANIMNPDSAN